MNLLTQFKLGLSNRGFQSAKRRLHDKNLESLERYLKAYIRWGNTPVKLRIQISKKGSTCTTIRPKKGFFGVGYQKPSVLLSKVLKEKERRKRRRESSQASTG